MDTTALLASLIDVSIDPDLSRAIKICLFEDSEVMYFKLKKNLKEEKSSNETLTPEV